MRRFVASLGVLAALLAASGASAGTLSSATWVTETLGGLGNAPIPRAVPVVASGASTPSSIAVSLTLPAFTSAEFRTGGLFNIYSKLILSGAAMFTATPNMASATQPIGGEQLIKPAVH